jgi:hypothetical protein
MPVLQTTTTNDSPARAPGPQRPRLFAGRGPSFVVGRGPVPRLSFDVASSVHQRRQAGMPVLQTTTTNGSPARAPGPQRPRLFAGRGSSVVVGRGPVPRLSFDVASSVHQRGQAGMPVLQTTTTNDDDQRLPGEGAGATTTTAVCRAGIFRCCRAGTCAPPVVRRCLVRSSTGTGRDACPTNDDDQRRRPTTTTNDSPARAPGPQRQRLFAGRGSSVVVGRGPVPRLSFDVASSVHQRGQAGMPVLQTTTTNDDRRRRPTTPRRGRRGHNDSGCLQGADPPLL